MREYVKVEVTTDDNTVFKLMKQGWEIISTNNYVIEPPDSRTQYHLGLPANVRIEQLRNIIKKYEELGFKDQLLQKVAEENEDSLDNYSNGGGSPAYGALPRFMEEYEDVVNDKKVHVYKKLDKDFF